MDLGATDVFDDAVEPAYRSDPAEEIHVDPSEADRVAVFPAPTVVPAGVVPEIEVSDGLTAQGGHDLRSDRHYGHREGHWRERKEYGLHISVNKALKQYGKSAVDVMSKEILQMTATGKGVFEGVLRRNLSFEQRKSIIRSSMFFKEKYLPSGDFDKLKARLVAGGNMQDKSVYSSAETSSPAVSLSSVYMIAAIAAKERRAVATMDVSGAYLNAPMKRDVFMSLEPQVAKVLVDIDENFRRYLNEDGSLIVRLKKALYGCIESAKLWYEHISSLLIKNGFEPNQKDVCVFNKEFLGSQCTICLYVDDLFVTHVNKAVLDMVHDLLVVEYSDLSDNRGVRHSYLGQTFDFSSEGKVKISMKGYVEDIVSLYGVKGVAVTPATNDLFVVKEDLERLSGTEAEVFHSRVAKLLYLAKRVRPDILTAVSYLATRIQCSTSDDMAKLSRVLRYINGSQDLGIVLDASEGLQVMAYIDASYGVHGDYKSHTGAVISIGMGPIFVKSSKQKLVSKSSTEAELIGVSDALSQVIWTRDFLIEQGHAVNAAKVFQDNMSTMIMAQRGLSNSDKTRHIAIRFFWVKDRIEAGEIEIEHMPTADMIADVMTKPLQGELFRKMRRLLLNCE
jgi:histone deacetylase 1/2